MAPWISENDFIKADVIRWTEVAYKNSRRINGKPVRLGERRLTAEVLSEGHEDGWVHLLVRGCEILSEMEGRSVPLLKLETEIKRAHKTILRGKLERLLWSDESVRARLASRFWGNREPLPSGPPKNNKPQRYGRNQKRPTQWKPPKK